jgi:hypothetical protein
MEIEGTFRIKSLRHGSSVDIWMQEQECALFLLVDGVEYETHVPCSVLTDLWRTIEDSKTIDDYRTCFLE